MARKAMDGTEFTNGMALNRHNHRLKAKGFNQPAASSDGGQSDDSGNDQPQSITDDPKAMRCIDELQQMGYTADDVAQAMDSLSDQGPSDDGSAATAAAPMQLPGIPG